MIIISPPFGNYIEIPGFVSVKGSFTLYERDGLFLQIIKTLRYSFENKGWVNKIGLRNKGIDYAINKYNNSDHIISIAILNKGEIPMFLNKIPNNMNIELNVSCPNVNKNLINSDLKGFINKQRNWCIIKLSPIVDKRLIDSYYNEGFRQFHCSNTLPVENGGQSGQVLKKHNKELITYIKNKYPDTTIIGGGGIRNWEDILYYKNMGCEYYSLSTVLFNPFAFVDLYIDIYKNK